VIGMFFLGRMFLGGFGGALAAILLATNPLYATYALCSWAHISSTCFTIWAMFFTWRWGHRGGWVNAALAAGCISYAASIRYTDILLLLPLGFSAGVRFWDLGRGSSENGGRVLFFKECGVIALAGIIVALPMLIHHTLAFGAPWKTGYSYCEENTAFSWQLARAHGPLLLEKMGAYGMKFIFPLGLLSLAFLLFYEWKRAIFLALWIIPTLLLYLGYYYAPTGENPYYVRFFITIFPPLMLSALSLVFLREYRVVRTSIAFVLILCVGLYLLKWNLLKNISLICLSLGFVIAMLQLRSAAWRQALVSLVAGLLVFLVVKETLPKSLTISDWQMHRKVFFRAVGEVVSRAEYKGAVIFAMGSVQHSIEYFADSIQYEQNNFQPHHIAGRAQILQQTGPTTLQRKKIQKLVELLGNKTDSELSQTIGLLLAEHAKRGEKVYIFVPDDWYLPHWKSRFSNLFEFEPVFAPFAQVYGDPQTPSGNIHFRFWTLIRLKLKKSSPTATLSAPQEWKNKLLVAIKEGRVEDLETLLKESVDVNFQDETGYTPLGWAILYDRVPIFEKLVRVDANLGSVPAVREGIQGYAFLQTNPEILKLMSGSALFEVGEMGIPESERPRLWFHAAAQGHSKVIQGMVQLQGMDLEMRDPSNRTAMMIAHQKGHTEVVKLLSKAGARQ
jgi:hypothetical protein